ncbi:hypothetical protein OSCI_580024 [Kamptonema sp. PCC 6506]|nr:hypothetical protein OSCI_580024 [Kamptonema sp. PCC 6506]
MVVDGMQPDRVMAESLLGLETRTGYSLLHPFESFYRQAGRN